RCARGEALSVRARVRAHRELLREVAVYPQQPRLDLDVPEHRDLRSRALDLKLVEPSYLGHDRELEAPDELVVAFHRLAECAATVLDMLRHDGDAPIELAAELVHALRVHGDLFLTPAARDARGEREARRGARHPHPRAPGGLH